MNDASPNGKVKREFYLNHTDAAEELGITPYKLTALTAAVGIDACGKGHGCRYTAADVQRLRGVANLMTKYPISSAAAARIQADIDANKAARSETDQISQATRTVAARIA